MAGKRQSTLAILSNPRGVLSLHVDGLSGLAGRSLQLSPREQSCEEESTRLAGRGARSDRLRQTPLCA